MNGVHPIGTTADVPKTEIYASDFAPIPQHPAPVGINLRCFKETPSAEQSLIIRHFQFVPE